MAESKFAGALNRLKRPQEEAATDPQAEIAVIRPQQGKGRPAGKRSDPAFKPFTLLLRERTHRQARRKLEDTDASLDLSELVEKLLNDWMKQA